MIEQEIAETIVKQAESGGSIEYYLSTNRLKEYFAAIQGQHEGTLELETVKEIMEKLPRLSYVCALKNYIVFNKNNKEEVITYLRTYIKKAQSSGIHKSQPVSVSDLNRVFAYEVIDQSTFPVDTIEYEESNNASHSYLNSVILAKDELLT